MKKTIPRPVTGAPISVSGVADNRPSGGQLSPYFKKERLSYIGGSDAAGVLGMSRWDTPLSVWAEKTGKITRNEPETLPQKLGKRLESVVAELFMEATGKKVRRVNQTIFHEEYPFLGANVDRLIVGEDAGLECKTASAWKAKEWEGDEIPREYILQCHHYLAVTGKERWYLAVLIGNQDFKLKVIEREERLLTDIINREVSFWTDYVLGGQMPEVITKYDADTLSRLYPQAVGGKEILLTDEANQLIENLDGFKSDAKNLEGLIDQTENKIKVLLGDAERGVTSLHKVYWTNSSRSSLDIKLLEQEMPDVHAKYYKSKPTRRFSIKKINEEK